MSFNTSEQQMSSNTNEQQMYLYLSDYDPMGAPRPWLTRNWIRYDGEPGIKVDNSPDSNSGVMQFPGRVYRDYKYAPSTPPPNVPYTKY